jgi:hypothetical protein
MRFRIGLLLVVGLFFVTACEQDLKSLSNDHETNIDASQTPTMSTSANSTPVVPAIIATELETSPTEQMDNVDWRNLPVIPASISERTIEIYRKGQEFHNNPYAFSVVGDCDSSPSWFLGDFDRGPSYYSLGEYFDLELVINAFQGSFERESLAVRSGFNSASVLSPLWADPQSCQAGEMPLDCEIRLHHPAFVFVLLGTNDSNNLDTFESNMRIILNVLVENGIVPILATKADNLEGGSQINATIARLATEYEVPFWNFWRAVQELPNHGLQTDGAHLTWDHNLFDDPKTMLNAWPWRNLTALQVLDYVWRSVQTSYQ